MRTFTMIMVLCLGATAASAQRAYHAEELEHALHGLERGIEALAMLEKPELHAQLERLADQVRHALEQAHRGDDRPARELQPISRELTTQRLETMKLAIPALRKAERHEAAERLEIAAKVYALALAGQERETRELAQRAPRHEEQVELLTHAEHLYRELNMPDHAAKLSAMTEKFWHHVEGHHSEDRTNEPRRIVERHVERRGDREIEREIEREVVRDARPREDRDRAIAQRHLEIMRTAFHAFREAEREDAMHAMEHVIHARELELAGHDGPDARHIRETAPKLGGQVELLTHAANIWDEFGHESKADQLRELAQHYRRQMEQRERGARERERAVVEERDEREMRPEPRREMAPERERQLLERIERLEATLRDVVAMLREMREREGEDRN